MWLTRSYPGSLFQKNSRQTAVYNFAHFRNKFGNDNKAFKRVLFEAIQEIESCLLKREEYSDNMEPEFDRFKKLIEAWTSHNDDVDHIKSLDFNNELLFDIHNSLQASKIYQDLVKNDFHDFGIFLCVLVSVPSLVAL